MKVASAVVVLLSLIVLAYSAPNCGENGVQDQYADKYCNCFSGYAPSDKTQKDCNADAQCPFRVPVDTLTAAGGYQPKLFNTTFKADRYNAIIRFPIVQGRRNVTIRFNNGEDTCGYPGNLWFKQVNSLDCVDEFIGSMPWSSHSQCGFNQKDIRGYKTTYSAKLRVSYDDTVKDGDEIIVRTIEVLMGVNVTFTTTSKLIFSFIDLTAGNTYVKVSVIGDVIYDANNIQGSVTLRTKATWPYTVEGIIMSKTPYPNTAAISPDLNFDINAGCTNVTKSDCTQQYVMRIAPNGGCNIGGSYVFNITLGCRRSFLGGFDICAGASYTSGSYSVKIYDTDICGVGGVDVSLSNGQLMPYADRAGNTPASNYLPNSWVYFSYSIQSDAATIDVVSVDSITASTAAGVSDVLYDSGATVKGVAAGLAIDPAATPVAPGTPATLWFQVQLIDAVSSFRVLPSSAATVTMTIIVNVQYHGNQKRTIQAVASVTSSKGLADIYISENGEASTGDNLGVGDSAAASLSPVSPFLFFILALVLMTALRY